MNPTEANYITKTYGYSPKSSKKAYTFLNFGTFQSQSFATGENGKVSVVSHSVDYTDSYKEAIYTVHQITKSWWNCD